MENLKMIILKELKTAEKIQKRKIEMTPIVDIYDSNNQLKLNHIRDYIWFGEKYNE